MENQILGILTLSVGVILTFAAYKSYQTQKYTLALGCLLIVGLVLRLFVATDFYLHEWDERYHALVAKNMMEHPLKPTLYENPILPYDYKSWSTTHVWLHKQPVALWCMALSMKVFGVNEIALRLPSLLFSVLAIWLTFQIALLLFGRKVAFIAAFLHAIHGLLIELTGGRVPTDHIDIAFQFFIELGVYFGLLSAKKDHIFWAAAMGIFTGIAVLTKWLPALIVLPVWFLLKVHYQGLATRLTLDGKRQTVLQSHETLWLVNCCLAKLSNLRKVAQGLQCKKTFLELGLVIVLIAAIALPWQLYIHQTFPLEAAYEQAYNTRHLFEQLEGLERPITYHLTTIRIVFGELIYLPLIWLFYMTFKKWNRRRLHLWALSAWIFIPFLFFTLAATKMQAYTMISAPAFFILTALFYRYLLQIAAKLKPRKIALLWKFIAVLLIALPIRYSIERLKPFHAIDRNPAWAQELKEFCGELDPNSANILVQTLHPVEAMFYCNGLVAYEVLPSEKQLDSLLQKGYRVYIKKEAIAEYKN